ncbi:MAG: serine hydrolase [Desulfuromonas sp.]|nr:serine hydrolase [Desulfuromonas sp.]
MTEWMGWGRSLCLLLLVWTTPVCGYPLDGTDYTGITRLQADHLVQQGQMKGRHLPKGALLPLAAVDIRLEQQSQLVIPEIDLEFQAELVALLGEDADNYALAVLDLSDPAQPRYAEHHGDADYSPGSLGKLMIVLGIFQALADLYPDDIAAREQILRHTQVTADQFIRDDFHRAPFWQPGDPYIRYRKICQGDSNNLWGTLDWMMSASSNAAASLVLRELMLMVEFGSVYPPTVEQTQRFWQQTPRKQLSQLLSRALHEPVARNGLDPAQLRQGGFFTRRGKQLVPGKKSHATPRALVEFLLKMEQGRLVDPFSSREIKRLLYMTERRIRYASHPALHPAAVYFKSGSLYRCKAEEGFVCKKYQGNVDNLLNSVAIIESPAEQPQLHYLVVVMSNVLRKNSAVAHQTFAMRLHRLLEKYHAENPPHSDPLPKGEGGFHKPQGSAMESAVADKVIEGDDQILEPDSR